MSNENLSSDLENPLLQMRLTRFWSQDELAAKSGVDRSTIGRLEQNKQKANRLTLARLKKAFGIEPGTPSPLDTLVISKESLTGRSLKANTAKAAKRQASMGECLGQLVER